MKHALKIVAVNILVFAFLVVILEATGQAVAVLRPSYDVLFLQPDTLLGWKQVPNLQWTWAGHEWYAADFSVRVRTNALGFRDSAREFAKPAGIQRVALLGDSFIEAVQVPFERTAGQVLQQQLNGTDEPPRWEVLNFGISNYGVGQYLLAWREYARKFNPDYVGVFVAKLHMRRTLQKYESGAFPGTEQRALWIRPTFRLQHDALVLEPAADIDAFVRMQNGLVSTEFDGLRTRRKKRLITYRYAKLLYDDLRRLVHARPPETPARPFQDDDPALLAVNLKIIETFGREVAAAGGRLAVVDATRYFSDGDGDVAAALKNLCAANRFGYVPVFEDLLDARKRGVKTDWAHDGHFNEAGNTILANALYRWVAEESGQRQAVR